MVTKIRRLDGWIPGNSPGRDRRDFNITQLPKALVVLPESYLVVPKPIILDQGSTSECVAYASAGLKSDQEWRQSQVLYRFNADWLYHRCKLQDGIPYEAGTYPRVACDIMLKQGMQLAGCRQHPDIKWGIGAYYGITANNTDEEIKQVLFQYGSILVAGWWYDNWMAKFPVFPDPGNKNGGHCWRLVGWVPGLWVMANSWGPWLWGDGGMANMPASMFRSIVLPDSDTWKVIDRV